MHRTVATWDELAEAFHGMHNFLMTDACVPFAFDFPPIDELVDELRRDEQARITRGQAEVGIDGSDIREMFRDMPIADAMRQPFALAHFALDRFYGPGQAFYGFEQQVLDPWRAALRRAGFTWERCYPICFVSGAHCMTGYHMDFSHVIAWQTHGTKRFIGYREPDRWAPRAARHDFMARGYDGLAHPCGLTAKDELTYMMNPGDVLWNIILTPHRVVAGDTPACSINLSHRGVRLNGRLCDLEQERYDWAAAHGQAVP